MEFRGLMGGFYRISEWIMRFSVTNILWIVGALPVFFFGFSLLMSTDEAQVRFTLLLVSVLSPFLLFPSTTAMFALARKWVTGDGDVPLLKTFFTGYKENYKQSMLGGLFFVVVIGIMYFNLHFYSGQAGFLSVLTYLFIALFLIVIVAVFNFFCITVHLHMNTWQVIKNSFLLTIGQPIRSILIAATNAAIVYISFTYITFLIPFFMGSLVAFMTFWHFHNGFRKIVERQEKAKEAREQAENGDEEAEESETMEAPEAPEAEAAERSEQADRSGREK
ncbi:YesL family protein [Paenibacillus thermotolerans]|uniref:YesL family protein n=1 Tax=Paenibacillus thermotolerans TaxID=3027807 RepID=UPI002368B6B3|nr:MULTISPECIES: DUF624 domain-containing protein [unclassified Paenibacillus]